MKKQTVKTGQIVPAKTIKTLREPLARVLSVKRMSGSAEEAEFRVWLVKRYVDNLKMVDEAGNLWFEIGKSRTLFAAHCDSVHRTTGANKYTVEEGVISSQEECLGADDGAGVAILCHMLSNKVPGTYIFTTQEEVGGVGAKYIKNNFHHLLSNFDRSICFDRAGFDEIITVQGGARCASTEFAEALELALLSENLKYKESVRGVYTDNREWCNEIFECVNLSVGYDSQHGPNESLDLAHLESLAKAVIKIDWEALPTVRDPFTLEPPTCDWGRSDTWDTDWRRNATSVFDDAPLRSDTASEYSKTLTSDLKAALELAEFGYYADLNDVLSKERATPVKVTKFEDSQYYLSELLAGEDPYEVIDQIYWSIR